MLKEILFSVAHWR